MFHRKDATFLKLKSHSSYEIWKRFVGSVIKKTFSYIKKCVCTIYLKTVIECNTSKICTYTVAMIHGAHVLSPKHESKNITKKNTKSQDDLNIVT